MPSTHNHPHPTLNRITQTGALVVFVLMLLAALAQVVAAFTVPAAGFLILSALFTLLLALPVLMLTASAPAVTVAPDGLTLHPVVWRETQLAWRDVRALEDYPLLPPPNTEVGRTLLLGRRRYQPAAGIMLVVPRLPPQYRVHGFFAGAGFTPVIAFTSRTHTDYDKLVKKARLYYDESRAGE